MRKIIVFLLMLCIAISGCQGMNTPGEVSGEGTMPITKDDESAMAMQNDEEAIKNVIYGYFSGRHEIRANITSEPFDAKSDAVLKLLGCCAGDEFINETLITRQMEYEQQQIVGQRREMDMSYKSYAFDIEYKTIEIDGQKATVNAKDEITFRLIADPDVESSAGDWHELLLEKSDGEWKITGDEEGEISGYYAERYRAYKAEYNGEDTLGINEYVLERFRNEVTAGLDAGGF